MIQPVTIETNAEPKFATLVGEFQPDKLIPTITSGLVTGLIGVIRSISYAALIFSGSLSIHLSTGVGMAVLSTAIVSSVFALTSGLPGAIATPLAAPSAIIAMFAAAIATKMVDAPSSAVLATVLTTIALASFLTGSFLWLLGRFKLGEKIRFIPYPVVGGFMAGTGWLLVRGAFQVMTDEVLTWGNLTLIWQPEILWHWLSGLTFALILLLISRRYQHFSVMPGTLLASVAFFYLILWGTSTTTEIARDNGWLLGPFPEGGLWQPLTWHTLSEVNWSVIASQSGAIATVMVISLLSLMLSNSGIELVVGRDLKLDRELQAVGLANLAAGFGSGMAGNQALPSTLLVNKIGGHSRLTGIFTAMPCLAVLLLGSSFLSFLPKPVLGSLLLYLGISLLIQWVYQGWFKLSLVDYLTVIVTLIVINTIGFLEGVFLGFVIAVVIFMYDYSQIDVAKKVLSGNSTKSNVDRLAEQSQLLTEKGDKIFILELQGYLFFGTANYLLTRVRDRIEAENPLSFIIIDFRQVAGLDASAVLSFNKILKIARKNELTLLFTNLNDTFQKKLIQGQGLELDDSQCLIFPDIDRGLEWCENQLIDKDHTLTKQTNQLSNQLKKLFLQPEQVNQFLTYLEPKQVDANYYIFRPEKADQGLYFIETGQVSVLLELAAGKTKRLQTLTAGNLLGEMRFYGKVPLSTYVVTDTPSQLYYLSESAFESMKQEAPELATNLQEYIVRLLCDSLTRRQEQLRVMS